MGKGRIRVSKELKEQIFSVYGNRCINCGDDENIEFHHVVPLEIGGYDTPSNMVPLCHACHKAVTFHQLTLQTFGREHKKRGGRKRRQWPEETDDVFTDYVRCRISKKECCDRLRVDEKFIGTDRFKQYKEEHGIYKYRNNIDLHLSMRYSVQKGEEVGYIKYKDGTYEYFYWGNEEPTTGESDVPTGESYRQPQRHHVGNYIMPFK